MLFLCAFFAGNARSQVVNGDFSPDGTGWSTVVPTGSSLTFTGTNLVTVSDDDGTGTNSQTYAFQSLTTADPGFLSWVLVSYTSTDRDLGAFDFPMVLVDTTFFQVNTSGGLQTVAAGAIDNDDTGTINNLDIVTTLAAAGTRNIGAGVTSADSLFGPGTATWDDIEFQEITQSPGAQNTIENTPLVFSGANVVQTASNALPSTTITVTLSVANGTVSLGNPGVVTITGGADGSSSVTFQGNAAAINAALDGMAYTPGLNFVGVDTLNFAASGAGISDTDTVPIIINPGVRAISVTKTADDTTDVVAGQTITYTYVVTNDGDQVITSVTLTDAHNGSGTPPVPGGENLTTDAAPTGDSTDAVADGVWDVLAPGDQVTFTATYVVTQNDVDTLQ